MIIINCIIANEGKKTRKSAKKVMFLRCVTIICGLVESAEIFIWSRGAEGRVSSTDSF